MLQVEDPLHYPHSLLSPHGLDIFHHQYCVNIFSMWIKCIWVLWTYLEVRFAKLLCCKGMFSHQNIASPRCRLMVEICIWHISFGQICSISKLCSSLASEKTA